MKINFFLVFGIILLAVQIVHAQKSEDSTYSYTNPSPYTKVSVAPQINTSKPKNIILMIGDGMGLDQVATAWVANRGQLNLDNFNHIGLSRTYAADRLITDSGASGTAMATGYKAPYHAVGIDAVYEPQMSILTLASKNKLSTGLLVTSNITDATPASFCAHNRDRENEEAIALDFLTCNVDFVFGGGKKLFTDREDKRNLLTELNTIGFQTPLSLSGIERSAKQKIFLLPVEGQLDLASDRGALFQEATMIALSRLDKNENGFIAVIEGSRIDDAGHWNDLPKLMGEIFDFDQTIGGVLQWAAEDEETLVIVTADHETGALSLLGGDLEKGQVKVKFNTTDHSGILVPVYAYGPGSEHFDGIYENTEIFKKISKLLNLKN